LKDIKSSSELAETLENSASPTKHNREDSGTKLDIG